MFFCPKCGADRRAIPPVDPCPRCAFVLEVPATALTTLHGPDDDAAAPARRRRWPLAIALIVVSAGTLGLVAVLTSDDDTTSTNTAHAVDEQRRNTEAATEPRAVPPAPPPVPAMPKWIELRVERVEVTPSGVEWDGTTAERSLREDCESLAGLTSLAKGGEVLGLACLLLTDDKQRQADPRDPDLMLVLDVDGVAYASYVAPDRSSHLFGYRFLVPGAAIPPAGVVIGVADADDDAERGREIASVRLTRDELATAAATRELITRSTDRLARLEVSVRERTGKLEKQEVSFDASKGGTQVAGIEVSAGDVVRIEAGGAWQIGTWNDATLGPLGYADGRLRGSNLDAFRSFSHGSAVALVGIQGARAAVAAAPCARFVAPHSGVVWVGINDNQPGDNRGTIGFRVFRRPADERMWRSPGTLLRCEQQQQASPASGKSALDDLERLRARACACRDTACATRAQEAFDQFLERHKDTRGDQDTAETIGRLAGQMSECLARAMTLR